MDALSEKKFSISFGVNEIELLNLFGEKKDNRAIKMEKLDI